jgi:hypothetical protein
MTNFYALSEIQTRKPSIQGAKTQALGRTATEIMTICINLHFYFSVTCLRCREQ